MRRKDSIDRAILVCCISLVVSATSAAESPVPDSQSHRSQEARAGELITRGALTTFSVANDMAKYFAIIPAMFAAAFPQLEVLNAKHIVGRQFGLLGEPRVNVVELNLDLDASHPKQ
jgi:hypothetical protein